VPTSQLAHAHKRRSTRIDQAILLTVRGLDAFRAPYAETVPTITLSCHGCRYRSKHKVILGDVVSLQLQESANAPHAMSTQARVRWLKPGTVGNESIWDVAVELEAPGNFWGMASPPDDWLLSPDPEEIGWRKSAQGLRIASRSEQQAGTTLNRAAAQLSDAESTPASPDSFFALSNEDVQKMLSEAATDLVTKEKESLIGQFRSQLQDEMTKTLDRVIGQCKEELVHRALRELTKELEASARGTQEHCIAKVEENLSTAATRMTAAATEVSDRIEHMAATAIERLQQKMDTLRRETIGELKIELLKICQQNDDFCRQSTQEFVKQTQERISELKNQLDADVNDRIEGVGTEMDRKSSAILDESRVAVLKLSQACQETVQVQLRSLSVSAVDELSNTLNERAAEMSKQSMSELQDWTRRYLESVSGSLAELSKKTAAYRHD
jgi:hypothetical protein